MAACRFWISRIQTAIRKHAENRVSEDVLEKDPNEMRWMVVERLERVQVQNMCESIIEGMATSVDQCRTALDW